MWNVVNFCEKNVVNVGCKGVTRVTHAPTFHFKVAGTSFLAGELVILMRHAREKRAKEVRDLKGEKFETNMAARGLFRSTKLLSYFVRSLPISVYLMYSTATVYAGDRNENKEDDSRRRKGCFASKRKIQSIRNLATAKKERTQVKENLPEEEKDCEPPRKIKKRSQQVSYVLHRCCILAGSTEICYVFFFPFLLLILDNQIPEIK